MRKVIIYFVLAVFCLSTGSVLMALSNDVKEMPACRYCGMSRETFAHSRMLIEYEDSSTVAACSLHCASLDLALNLDRAPKAIRVADYNTKELIDAETAHWVLGGKKPGVMTRNAKWTFAKEADAEKFRLENGGRLAGFDEALETAYKDLANDTKMIREKRKMMKKKMMEKKG
jgi:copper chaperone NosL